MLFRLVVVSVLTLVAPATAADEALQRRLAALRAVVEPVRPRPPASLPVCPDRGRRPSLRERTRTAIRDASRRFGLPAALIRSVIRHESNHDPDAVSPRGAMGLMQLMPATARELGVTCAFDPRQNVLAGSRYLRRLRDELGSWPRALAAYHAGPARVRSGRLPAETRRYVARVLTSWGRAIPAELRGSR